MALRFLNSGYFAGKVGIGVESPDGNLEVITSTIVSGASDTVNNVLIGLQAANRPTIILDTADTTYTNRTWNITNVGSAGKLFIGRNGLDVMVMDNSGKVGIGTTDPIDKLNVYGGTGDAAAQQPKITVTRISSTGNVLAGKMILTTKPSDPTNHGNLVFQVKTTASSGESSAYYTNAITIDGNNANVGIGTDSPGSKLTVNGQVQVGPDTARRYALQPSQWGYSSTYRTLILGSASTTYNTNDTGSVTLAFGVDVSANTSGSFTGNGKELLFRNLALFNTPNSSNDGYLNLLTFNDGDVGIGTDSPDSQLTVSSGTTNAVANFKSTDGTAYIAIADDDSSSALDNQIGVVGDDMYFATADVEKLRITSSGQVGIGGTPQTTLADAVTIEIGASGIIYSEKAASQYNSLSIGSNWYYDSTNSRVEYKNAVVPGATNYLQYQGEHVFRTAVAPTAADDPITWSNRLIISNDGDIGIGNGTINGRVDIKMDMLGESFVPDGTSAQWAKIWNSAGTLGQYFNDAMLHLNTNRAGGATGGAVGIAFSPGWSNHQNWGIYSFNTTGSSYTSGDLAFVSQLNSSTIIERVRFNGVTGNVGIGEEAPDFRLDVNKDYTSGNGKVAKFRSGNDSTFVNFDTVQIAQQDVPCLSIIETSTGTQADEQKLTFAVGDARAVIGLSSTVTDGLSFYTSRAVTATGFAYTGILALHLENDGKVGVATSAPIHPLYVSGDIGQSDGSRIWFRGSSSSSTVGSQSYVYSNGLNLQIKGDDNVQLLGDGGGVIAHFDYTGKVGINTVLPKSKLQVDGGIQMADDTDDAVADKAGTMRYRTATDEPVPITGTDLVTNGDLASSTGWYVQNSSSINNTTGVATVIGAGSLTSTGGNWSLYQSNVMAPSKTYMLRFQARRDAGPNANMYAGWAYTNQFNQTVTADWVQYQVVFTTGTPAWDELTFGGVTGTTFEVKDISVVEVTEEDASYVDMCMQTGASTYEWVNIVRNTY